MAYQLGSPLLLKGWTSNSTWTCTVLCPGSPVSNLSVQISVHKFRVFNFIIAWILEGSPILAMDHLPAYSLSDQFLFYKPEKLLTDVSSFVGIFSPLWKQWYDGQVVCRWPNLLKKRVRAMMTHIELSSWVGVMFTPTLSEHFLLFTKYKIAEKFLRQIIKERNLGSEISW